MLMVMCLQNTEQVTLGTHVDSGLCWALVPKYHQVSSLTSKPLPRRHLLSENQPDDRVHRQPTS